MTDAAKDTSASDAPQPDAATPAKPKKRGRWRRRLLIGGIALLLLVIVAPLALALPPVKSFVADQVGARLGREVEIGKAFAFWGHGITLEDIRVKSPQGFDAPLATVGKVHADVDVLALVTGGVKARVEVQDPHVVIETNANNETNADGVLENLRGKDEAKSGKKSGGSTAIDVRVRGGVYEERRQTQQGPTTDRLIEGFNLDLGLTPTGHLAADVDFRAIAAQLGGGDALLEADLDLDERGYGPFSVSTPALDLERLARIIGRVAGLESLGGRLRVQAKGRLVEGQGVAGTFELGGGNLRARLSDETEVAIGKLHAVAQLHGSGDTKAEDTIVITLEGVGAKGMRDGKAVQFEEPSIELRIAGRWEHERKTLRVRTATLKAGAAVRIEIVQPVELRMDENALRAQGELTIAADLSSLGRLETLVPALRQLRSGVLGARVRANPGDHLELAYSARVTQLTYVVDPATGEAYRDPQIDITGSMRRHDDGVTELWLNNLATAAFRRTPEATRRPLYVRMEGEHITVDGPLDGDLDLARLQQAAPFLLSLEPGERVAGTVALRGTATGKDQTMQAALTVAGRNLVTPASWGRPPQPANIDARLKVEQTAARLRIDLEEWRGLGIGARGHAQFDRNGATSQLAEAGVRAAADLGQLAPWLVGFELLPAGTRMGGRLDMEAVVKPQDEARHITGKSTIQNLAWQTAPSEPILREPSVVIEHDILLGPQGGAHEARRLSVKSSFLTLTTQAARYVPGDDADLELEATLQGDAARLAAWMKPFLGEDYQDLRAQGRIQGRISARGGLGDHYAHLLVDTALGLGSWSTGGMTLTELSVTAARKRLDQPLDLVLRTGMNQGTVAVDAKLSLGAPAIPWQTTVTVRGVDTSGLVTGQGLNQGLLFMLPSLVPASAEIGALSGRLDVDAQLAAKDLGDPLLKPSLTGTAHVRMAGGTIKNSTLYGSLGGKLGQAGKALAVAVPEVGQVLTTAAKALTFSSLDSKARIANQIVNIESTRLEGPYLQLDMKGLVHFDKRVDMQARSTFVGSAGERVGKVLPGGAIPLRVRGSLDKPQVLPNLSLKDLKVDPGSLLGGDVKEKGKKLIDDLGKKAKKGLKGLLGG